MCVIQVSNKLRVHLINVKINTSRDVCDLNTQLY